MAEFERIIYQVENGRARITLNRPEKLNAPSMGLMKELNEAFHERDAKFGDGRARVKGPEIRDDSGRLVE